MPSAWIERCRWVLAGPGRVLLRLLISLLSSERLKEEPSLWLRVGTGILTNFSCAGVFRSRSPNCSRRRFSGRLQMIGACRRKASITNGEPLFVSCSISFRFAGCSLGNWVSQPHTHAHSRAHNAKHRINRFGPAILHNVSFCVFRHSLLVKRS